MKVRKYIVRNMREGLSTIKRELGDEAIILQTKRLATGELEIRVAMPKADIVEPEPPAVSAAEESFFAKVSGFGQETSAEPQQLELAPLLDMVAELRAELTNMREEMRGLRVEQELRTSTVLDHFAGVERERREEAETFRAREARLRERSFMQERRKSVAENLARLRASAEAGFPTRMVSYYETLLQAGVAREHVEELVTSLLCVHSELDMNSELIGELVQDEVAVRVASAQPLWRRGRGSQRVDVLVGPTGAGKTTTLAKIAARAKLSERLKVGLICMDTFRIGGVYQMETYAELIGVPMRVATSVQEFKEALAEFDHCDLVLVDTTGRSAWGDLDQAPMGPAMLEELRRGRDVHAHVVMSATRTTDDLLEMLDGYAAYFPSSLIFTKVDEARSLGGLLSACVNAGVGISHLCAGQKVPEDITICEPTELSARILQPGTPYKVNEAKGAAPSRQIADQPPRDAMHGDRSDDGEVVAWAETPAVRPVRWA